jgi:hypothetical protein
VGNNHLIQGVMIDEVVLEDVGVRENGAKM